MAFSKLQGLVFVNKCAVCKSPSNGILCDKCKKKLTALSGFCCSRCGKPPSSCVCKKLGTDIERSIACFKFENSAVSALVYKLKRRGTKSVVEFLAQSMFEKFNNEYSCIDFDYITYVPMSFRDKSRKGFDHAQILAKSLSLKLNIRLVRPPIKKRLSGKQKYQNAPERNASTQGVFKAKRKHELCGNVLLVDDVMTTGNTLSACAKLLKEKGAQKVYAITVATSVKK